MTAPTVHISVPMKSTGVAYLLWLFLGGFGAHKFYLGRPGLGCLYIVMLCSWWAGVFSLSLLMMAPLSLAILYDLFTMPRQVRAANDRLISGASGYFGSGSKRTATDDSALAGGDRFAKADQAIARYKAQQAANTAAISRPPLAATGAPTFGKRR